MDLPSAVKRAERFAVRGVVQGVGFRPFVFRLATAQHLVGWVRNGADGVEIHVEGSADALRVFGAHLTADAPPAARIDSVDVAPAAVTDWTTFEIRDSDLRGAPTVRIGPDLPICAACLRELTDPADRHHRYPYINCTDCGPRYSIVRAVPYDRARTTMAGWEMCARCRLEYEDVRHRRFHAQPVACPSCGPHYRLDLEGVTESVRDADAIARAARLLREGRVVAVKGIGGYHLACDATNADAVETLRTRKFRKERPFALMARDVETMLATADMDADLVALATGSARPIVLAPARVAHPGVSPENLDVGVMLPYAPVHHLLFALGAPDLLVMTSANRSSEPIAYQDDDARTRLRGLSDAMLVGERPIARRVDDSVVQNTAFGPAVVRRARGYAPGVVARLPASLPILAVGADLKNSVTLVVGGQALVSQHIGDLDERGSRESFDQTIQDLLTVYDVDARDLIVAHDAHPEYVSTMHARTFDPSRLVSIQHHRAHVASVLAERGRLDARVIGVAFDGTGYGDDGAIWGGEVFTGSVIDGFTRVGHLREAALPGGDAAARFPSQAAAGFLAGVDGLSDLEAPPFSFPSRFGDASRMASRGVRTFRTTSVGRLFDTAAALLGFTRPATFEGQAAIWLEHLARQSFTRDAIEWPFVDGEFDYRPALRMLVERRRRGIAPHHLARAFHAGIADGLVRALECIADGFDAEAIVLSGGVFQNVLLLTELKQRCDRRGLTVWTNREVPCNDGGISLGQAAIASVRRRG